MLKADEKSSVLTINAGSSSLKFAVFRKDDLSCRVLAGKIDRIGLPEARIVFRDSVTGETVEDQFPASNHSACTPRLLEILSGRGISAQAIGHRIVHGGPRYCQTRLVDNAMVEELRR